MTKLKVPSLQHLARLWRGDPQLIKKELLSLAENAPPFSYGQLFDLVRDAVLFKMPYEQAERAIHSKVKLKVARDSYLEILPLVERHFAHVRPDFVHAVARRFYPIGRGLAVPFDPPFIYGTDGTIHLPWFSFWKSNPLKSEQLALFATVVKEVIEQDAALDDVEFSILDFSAVKGGSRMLSVVSAEDIPRLSSRRTREMLETFSEGFSLASREYDELLPKAKEEKRPTSDESQLILFN